MDLRSLKTNSIMALKPTFRVVNEAIVKIDVVVFSGQRYSSANRHLM
jgi:hypothetical protein